MKQYIKNNWWLYLLLIPFIAFSIFLPDAKIEMSGGFAWAYLYIITTIFLMLIYGLVFGHKATFESKGLI